MKRKTILLLAALGLLNLFACTQDDSPTAALQISDDEYADAAEDFGATLAAGNEGFLTTILSESTGTENLDGGPLARKGAPVVQDTTWEHNGLTFTVDRTFYDAEGNPSEVYDSLTTVRTTRHLTITGTIVRPHRTATIDHDGFIDRTGIAPDDTLSTINGFGEREVTSVFQPRWRPTIRHYHGFHEWTINGLKVARDREIYPWPLEGTIAGHTVSQYEIEHPNNIHTRTVDITFTVTFDGTQYAHVEIENGPEYWVDLSDGTVYFDPPGGN
jgi:hypothetical protein